MLDDLSKTVKAQLYERVNSPLLASFSLSWIVWNYRFILALTAAMPFAEKITYIDTHIFPTYTQVALQGTIFPLLSALFIIFIYPIPAKYVYQYWRKQQRDLKEIQQKIDDETPLSKEDARRIRREALAASIEFDKEIENKSAEIARLKDAINELERSNTIKTSKDNSSSAKQSELSDNDLDDLQIDMLEGIANSPNGIEKKSVIKQSKSDKVLTEYNLGELLQRELVTQNYSSGKLDYIIKATHLGLARLVKRVRKQA